MADNDPESLPDREWLERQRQHKRQNLERQRQQIFDESLRQVLKTQDGRRVLSAVLMDAGVDQLPYVRGYLDSQRATDFNCGRQSVGLALIDRIRAAEPEGWLRLQKFLMDEAAVESALLGSANEGMGE